MYQLDDREKQVLAFKASGHTCIEIGELINLSKSTVEVTLMKLYTKIGARNDVHATAIMMVDGQITADDIKLPRGMRPMTPS